MVDDYTIEILALFKNIEIGDIEEP